MEGSAGGGAEGSSRRHQEEVRCVARGSWRRCWRKLEEVQEVSGGSRRGAG